MSSLRYVFSLLVVFVVSACSEAIPTVTELTTPITQTGPEVGSVSAGGGVMQSTNFKIHNSIGPTAGEMVGSNLKIINHGVQ